MLIEIHLLQSLPPACLNRDENGQAKTTIFGGTTRARISSQCQKRAVRLDYHQNSGLKPTHFAYRSRSWLGELNRSLQDLSPDIDSEKSYLAAKLALEVLGAKLTPESNDANVTLFLGKVEIASLAQLLKNNWSEILESLSGKKPELPKSIAGAIAKTLKNGGVPGDIALFGRMMASLPLVNIDSAVQVTHAISTGPVVQSFDFFTAADDLATAAETGADHLGDISYNSVTYYRYANIDTEQLKANLGHEAADAKLVAEAFVNSWISALPTGRQNSFAAHTRPGLVLMIVRPNQALSLVNAFERPIRATATSSILTRSVQALANHWRDLNQMYGDRSAFASVCAEEGLVEYLGDLTLTENVASLISSAMEVAFHG